jgi:phosphatidylinositol glycan class K
VIDSFTYYNLEFLENVDQTSDKTLQELFDTYDPVKIASHPGIRSDLFNRPLDKVKVTDFFGNVQNVELTKNRYPLLEEQDLSFEEVEDNSTTTVKKYNSPSGHLHHSFLVEKNSISTSNFWLQSIFGVLSTVTIGYVICTSIM